MKIRIMVFVSLLSPSLILAEDIVLQTSDTQNTLLELYTSEGCNSCPAAEHLLNSFKEKTSTWSDVIPMAFHVDYWDYLGWKDKFAQASFGIRQRNYAQLQRRTTVYTPAFFVNGKSWRPGLFNRGLPKASGIKVGKLKVRITKNTLIANFKPHKTINQPLQLNVALLGMGFKTNIKAGENEGRQAPHEFVVLSHNKYAGKNKYWNIGWPLEKNITAKQYAIAAWVNTVDNLTPIQATGAYLPAGFIK